MSAPLELRPKVAAFAQAMERKLRANDHKGDGDEDFPEEFLTRAREELDELEVALAQWRLVGPAERDALAVLVAAEAADVANFAMFIADVCGALKDKP